MPESMWRCALDNNLETSLLALFEQGHDAMFVTDIDGMFTHVNQAFLNLYRYTKDDVIGQPIGMLKSHLHDEDLYQQIKNELENVGKWSGELCNTSYDGEIIHVWTQIIKTETGYTGIQLDLRERDRNTRQLEQAARLESISILAGGIAHEFNNILAGLQGHLHLIRRTIPKENIKETERMQRVNKLVERAAGLVHNMMVFSKQKQTVNQKIALPNLLEETIKLARSTVSKNIQLDLEINHRGLITLANNIQLEQVLLELMNNAGIALSHLNKSKPATEPRIIVQLNLGDHNQAEIVVQDNGPGMNAFELQHCMDPFFTTRPVGQGTGLGLSSVHSYVKQLGGSLSIESQSGIGTTARILLPLAGKTSQVQPLNRCILLVDDDEDIRFSLHEILTNHGYEVIDATDGIQALDLWQQHEKRIDAIVMDIVMPNMDGLEVARNIRDTGSMVPICMMTGYSEQNIQADLHVNLLRKPIDPELILKYLEHQFSTNSEAS